MIHTIAPVDAAALIESGAFDVVDVRTAREWATGHLPSARHVPLEELRADPTRSLPRDRVLLVCEKGTRSRTAAGIAERRGLAEVYTLDGGTSAWARAGLPLDRGDGAQGRPSQPAPPPAAASTPVEGAEQSLEAIIGTNVRELRTRQGLTLDALSRRAAVSRAQLGQIELGKGATSLNIAWRLARALDVPFATLVATAPRAGTTVLRRSKAKQIVSSEGRFGSRALFPPSEKGSVEFYELWLAGHSREDAEAHQLGTRENLVVTAGRLDLEVGDARYRLTAGDAILFSADVPHAYVNPSSDECWMCLVMSYAKPASS